MIRKNRDIFPTLSLQSKSEADALLTRIEVAKLLNISLVTLHNHNKKGILKPTHRIGRRVLYLKSVVMSSISLSNYNPLQLC
ncbi:MAG: DNA-binding protein [Flavobacterium sp.]|nr:MAG: DNA-binding protein [Flavobacterium sp.]